MTSIVRFLAPLHEALTSITPAHIAAGVAGLTTAVSGITWFLYRVSPLHRARAQAKEKLKSLRSEIARTERVIGDADSGLLLEARYHARARQQSEMAATPIEDLKKAGATNVRVTALKHAGIFTLKDVADRSASSLMGIHGVGAHTATQVVSAAKRLKSEIESRPPTLPKPDLKDRHDLELARATVKAVDVRRRLAAPLSELSGRCTKTDRAGRDALAKSDLVRWIGRQICRRSHEPFQDELTAVADETTALLRSEEFENLRGARDAVQLPMSDDDVRARFRAEYADCCATIDATVQANTNQGTGAGLSTRPGRIPDEIAEKVERFALDQNGLKVTLRPYQVFGAKFILVQKRSLLGDEMGLGKTIEAMAAANHVWKAQGRGWFLVVAPAGIIFNWIHEINQRTILPAHLLHGPRAPWALDQWNTAGGIGVTSYATLRGLIKSPSVQFPPELDLLVADEAHLAKNPEALRTRAVGTMARRAKRACFMTGTPMENRPTEFANLIKLLDPVRESGKRIPRPEHGIQSFQRAVAPYYLRRDQSEVLKELPERIETEEWVELEEEHSAYCTAVSDRNFMAMRRTATIGDGSGSAKLRRLESLVDSYRLDDRKVLIFSFFLDVLKAVSARLNVMGPITGSVPPSRRQALVDEFRNAPGHQILLCQIQAGGQGINLQAASVVIIMEPQLKPTIEEQAICRAHRMGQTEPVRVHRLLASDVVDERLCEMLAHKKKLFEQYARRSLVKDASHEAVQTEAQIAQKIIDMEQARLGASAAASA